MPEFAVTYRAKRNSSGVPGGVDQRKARDMNVHSHASSTVSHECSEQFGHQRCLRRGAAWDFVLDRAVDCSCPCHSCAQREPAWAPATAPPVCGCRCHLAAHLISSECQDVATHRVCLEFGMAWDLLTGLPADCRCACHATGMTNAPPAGGRGALSAGRQDVRVRW